MLGTTARIGACLTMSCALACVSGCKNGVQLSPVGKDRPDLKQLAYAFAPERIEIDPLTHLDLDSDGDAQIICYIAVRDEWGDTTKAVGSLQVQLYRSGVGLDTGSDVQELKWDVDLSDLTQNAALYDAVTMRYRLQLVDLPSWVQSMAEREERGADSGGSRIRLRAILTTIDRRGREQTLHDDFTIDR